MQKLQENMLLASLSISKLAVTLAQRGYECTFGENSKNLEIFKNRKYENGIYRLPSKALMDC